MQIQINGEPRTVEDNCSAADLIKHLGLEGRRIAMEINGEIQPRSGYTERRIAAGDCIEIVHAIGGG
ncbi:sulfur carrier protein ThiS [Methylonatrum kenyense]|uniref:sulfur carrier protein ThiS n=1 Tax=Methylonatrum kenyense TaxID=455253 RepID=UPI0020C12D57|nr:sulfur carrier protein ThiS [Methylonatrum kenyense]MCK8516702.1 sulfur carrier protein ThiS [Methylonatrum kenyense]